MSQLCKYESRALPRRLPSHKLWLEAGAHLRQLSSWVPGWLHSRNHRSVSYALLKEASFPVSSLFSIPPRSLNPHIWGRCLHIFNRGNPFQAAECVACLGVMTGNCAACLEKHPQLPQLAVCEAVAKFPPARCLAPLCPKKPPATRSVTGTTS